MPAPIHPITVNTYAELREDVQAFADGKYNFMMLLGQTGVGKTETVLPALKRHDYLHIKVKVTAYELYCALYEANSAGVEYVVIDDVKDIFRNKHCISLLTALTETTPLKKLSWNTASISRGSRETSDGETIETSFYTSMRLIIIVNEWETLSEDVRALESRGIMVVFRPSAVEVHCEVFKGGWYHDQEVYDFVFSHLRYLSQPSIRHYVVASEQRMAGRPWQKRLLEWICPDIRHAAILELMCDPTFESETKRAAEYHKRGYGSERQYWRLKKELESVQTARRLDQNPKLKQPKQVAAKLIAE